MSCPQNRTDNATVRRGSAEISLSSPRPTSHAVNDTSMTALDSLRFDNRFTRELPADPELTNERRKVRNAAFSRVHPTPVTAPKLVAHAADVGELIGLCDIESENEKFAQVFGGNRVLPDMDPFAMCYGGHQFGNWAGQLGDGRAINLGEVVNRVGEHWTLQLKGAGPTPYSRTADGLAVLRSSVREFLCSEAMFHLGVPTTRALSLVVTGEQVQRDMFYDGNPKLEPGAVVCRVAPSFVRFGNFELPSSRRDYDLLKQLVEHTIRCDYPELMADEPTDELTAELCGRWFGEVCRRTADMIVQWMRVGFVHGVMNTDNMSILGLTIDYGPYGWLEDFDPNWTPNTTDAQGRRYRFGHQPQIAGWNLNKLANSLATLFGEKPSEPWIELLQNGLEEYSKTFNNGWNSMMARKLGLQQFEPDTDEQLVQDLLRVLQLTETDMTIFFRKLADLKPDDAKNRDWIHCLQDAYYSPDQVGDECLAETDAWITKYITRRNQDAVADTQRIAAMNSTNPKYVLRNYLAQLAIDKAEAGDYQMITELLELLRHPYDEQPEKEEFAAKRPEWARHRAGCSMLSCSS